MCRPVVWLIVFCFFLPNGIFDSIFKNQAVLHKNENSWLLLKNRKISQHRTHIPAHKLLMLNSNCRRQKDYAQTLLLPISNLEAEGQPLFVMILLSILLVVKGEMSTSYTCPLLLFMLCAWIL